MLAGVALFSAPAFAQATSAPAAAADTSQPSAGPIEGQSPAVTTNPSTEATPAGGAEIVVTGSRIPQPNLTAVAPVTVVNSQDLKLQGVTRVEDILNTLPQVYAGQTSTLSNGADGTATVDLRDLGAVRTLVLINGRRLLPGDPGSSAADLNAIPSSLIKRVEVLTGGASSTYGADAVSGVVNFIMDTDFTGIRLDGQYSLYQHDNRNKFVRGLLNARTDAGFTGFGDPRGNSVDGGTVDSTLTIGTGFDDNHGHVTAYFGYRKVKAITQSARDYSACTIQNQSNTDLNQCGGSATSANGNALVFANGTSGSTFFNIGPNRTLVPGPTRYNFAPTNYFQRPDERYTGGFFAHYDVSDAFKPYMEFMFMDDRTVAQIAPSGDFGNTLTINCDNPLLSAQQRSIVCANENLIVGNVGTFPLSADLYPAVFPNQPVPGPVNFIDPVTGNTYNKGYFDLLRRNVEGGPRIDDREHTEYRGVIGAKGDLNKAFSYDAYYQYGRTLLSETYSREFSIARLTNALDVVDVNGVPTCRVTESGQDPNCVPYDVLGNNISQGALDYVNASGFQRGLNTEQIASGSITGNLGEYGIQSPFSTTGISFNIGTEYRKETLDLKTDNEFSTGDLSGQGAPTKPISGSFHVIEGFGEVQIPLVHDNFIYDFSFSGGYRYSSYSLSNGRSFNTNTYKIGGELAPVRDIRFRASYNRAVRVPNLQELFAPDIVALDGATDPCAGFAITAADTGCLAQGLRVGQTVTPNPAGQYNGLIGGNAALTPEKSTTKLAGVVITPSFVPRLAVSVDYYDIKVNKAVQAFGADATLTACTNTLNALACSLIHRNAAGSLWLTSDGYVTDLNQNIGSVRTKGIDVNASYSHQVSNLGSLSFSVVGTYLKKFVTDNGLTEAYNCAGYFGVTCGVPLPKWRSKSRVTFSTESGFSLSGQWRYLAHVRDDALSTNSTLNGVVYDPGSHIKAQSYFDLTATMALGDHYTFRLGANNLLDRQPPLVTSGKSSGSGSACGGVVCNGNTYPGVYDSLGRYLYASVTLDF